MKTDHTVLDLSVAQIDRSNLMIDTKPVRDVRPLQSPTAPFSAITQKQTSDGLNASMQSSRDNDISFRAPGEQLFTVQYRKVQFGWFSSKEVGEAFLEAKGRWKRFCEIRGPEDQKDMVEVSLADDLELAEEWNSYSVGSEDGFFL